MDVDPVASQPSTPFSPLTTASLRQPLVPGRDLSTRSQRPLKTGATGANRNPKLRRSPPRPLIRESEKLNKSKLHLSPTVSAKPIVPPTERLSGDEQIRKRSVAGESDKWEITPDGGSAGRGGRHFTVANVGNNGRIYLRPTIRPANQRYPQPQFIFPASPPNTAGLDGLTAAHEKDDSAEPQGSQWTALTPSSPGLIDLKDYPKYNSASRPVRHRRAMSDSTVQEANAAQEAGSGAFKVVISKPDDDLRSRTMEDIGLGPDGQPMLQVHIPSWKLGTPRFTARGDPVIRGSSYAGTEDVRSSNISYFGTNSLHPGSSHSRRPKDIHIPGAELLSPTSLLTPKGGIRLFAPSRATYISTHIIVEPSMFDALTFKPSCDDRSIVRYSSATGAVTAATPPRLVAEITSPSFLDYELISDFFLTFRSFLETRDLLRMLIARLKWALSRNDEAGTVVRVRTFVAIRHWVLNYFVEDFVVDYSLRVNFCNLLNDFYEELADGQKVRQAQLKVLAELKKCWRRVCAQYWDGKEFATSLGPEAPIAPGGIAGHRDAKLDPSFWETDADRLPQLFDFQLPEKDSNIRNSLSADVSRAGHIDSVVGEGQRPTTPKHSPKSPRMNEILRKPTSPQSIASVDVISCSFPTKSLRALDPNASYSLAAHPAEPSSIYTSLDPIASTPRALTGKRVRANPSHKRNNSLTDSLRDNAATEKVLYKNSEFLLTMPYAGSLVRGNLLPPGQAFVEILPSTSAGASRQTTFFQPYQAEAAQKEKGYASAMSGQGMKKLIGSVRRALSTRAPGMSPTQGGFLNIAPIGPRGATTNRLPGTAVVPQARPPRANGTRAPIRIDILGAKIAEDFKTAVREDAAFDAANNGIPTRIAGENVEYSAAHLDSSFELQPDSSLMRPASDTGITEGSKSIVIVNKALSSDYPAMPTNYPPMPTDFPAMTGALPRSNSPVEMPADPIMPRGVDPTPPVTPPVHSPGNTPRRSSYTLSQNFFNPADITEPVPPLNLDILLAAAAANRPSEDAQDRGARPSFDSHQQSPNRPPLSGVRAFHRRQQSSRSFRSNRSAHHRRWNSVHSAYGGPRSTVKSFDATTLSDQSEGSMAKPPPLRVLRRRPGGDLRGVTNVAELDGLGLQRSRSDGSLTTYTESFRSSYMRGPGHDSTGFVDVVSSDFSQTRAEVFSLGAVTEQQPKRQMSLFSTHSSKPIMRPSFEAEAKKLAQIPDDIDDDGGVEAALLKLEGKFVERNSRPSDDERSPVMALLEEFASRKAPKPEAAEQEHGAKSKQQHQPATEETEIPDSPRASTVHAGSQLVTDIHRASEVKSFLSDSSRDSYSSTPLLERGLTDDGGRKTPHEEWANHSILQGPDDEQHEKNDEPESHPLSSPLDPSYEVVVKTDSMDQIKSAQAEPKPSEHLSFLDVESDDDDDLSTDISGELIDPHEAELDKPIPSAIPLVIATDVRHNEGHLSPDTNPPSPPITLVQALQMSPESAYTPQLYEDQIWTQKPLPPTPDTTPTIANYLPAMAAPAGRAELPQGASDASEEPPRKFSVHLPFILAFDSEILAQQFTLIEKDALNEIDWKELIDMGWKDRNSDARSWVDFLRKTDARGVEVVVARFNIMVKWAISEIVLTQDIEERARCIIKFLHIAAHCRRYRNFATMSQITVALTSNEVSRLTQTWAMVTPADLKTMQDLEMLVSPTKNFYNLRAEMEGGATAAETGCIPFVGIYTHDLLFNSQRPSEIASSPNTPPLVNFERCRIAAGVVKTLLRLLEASTLYQFQPIEGITERCLWMGALSDDEIRRHSESLE